jgi:hypothetical protein
MAKSKSAAINDDTVNPIRILKEDTCPTSSGKSTLTFQVGIDESDDIHLKVSGNDGGGFWSAEWVSYDSIQSALTEWPQDQGITSMAFRKIFRGRSANTPGFLVAVLNALGILEPMGDKKRVHQACDPKPFLAEVSELQGGSSKKPKAKAAPKAKAQAKRTANTRRKTPATSRKGK